MPGDETCIIKGVNPNTNLVELVQVIDGLLQTNASGGDAADLPAVPTSYNVTLASADAEYSQALPANCRGFEFQARTAADVRFAFVTGRVAGPSAPYHVLKSGSYYWSFDLDQGATPSTLYLASSAAGIVVEIIAWV